MGERKVLNKYFPPDFDPKKVPRMKRDPEKQICVRMMIPFSLQCNTCGEFMYRGKKFNSLKEDCIGEDYLGIRRFRFYIKCVICSQEITFKTDPENGDYELETGASRNFESWTDKKATEDEHNKAREEEEKSDNMKQLENRTLDSKIELEIMDALDEIKAVNRRHEAVDTANVLEASAARREKGGSDQAVGGTAIHDEDDALIANIQFGGPKVRRLAEAGSGSDDSDGADSTGRSSEALVDAPPSNGGRDKGNTGKGKMRAAGASAQGAPLFRPARKAESALLGAEKGAPREAGEKGGGGGGDGPDAPGSRLLSAIEAQARREADKVKAAGMGTTVVVKRKKKKSKDKHSEGGEGSKKRKKHKEQSENIDRGLGGGGGGYKKAGSEKVGVTANKAENGGVSGPSAAGGASSAGTAAGVSPAGGAAEASALGGLNLLGSYDSSSGSDDASR